MPNERLRRAMLEAEKSIEDIADHVGTDPKTVERWITKGRLPHPKNRVKTAKFLGAEDVKIWPELANTPHGHATSEAEVIRIYPSRGAVPAGLWYELLEAATEHVDILVYAGLFLPDSRADFAGILREKAAHGVQIRLLYGDPKSPAVAQRGAEEGIGEGMAARITLTLSYLRPALDTPGIQARLHPTTLYNSLFRYDDHLLVNTHAYGFPAARNPVLHLREVTGAGLFRHYMESFHNVWTLATPIPEGS